MRCEPQGRGRRYAFAAIVAVTSVVAVIALSSGVLIGPAGAATAVAGDGTLPPLQTGDAMKPVPVGPGYVHAVTREVVRTAGGVVYLFAADDTAQRHRTGPGVIRAWKANRVGVPTAFQEVDGGHRPSGPQDTTKVVGSPDVRLDRAGVAHLVYTRESDEALLYQTFSTQTDTWGTPVVVAQGVDVPYNSVFHHRETTGAMVLDDGDQPQITWVANDVVMFRERSGGSWGAPVAIANAGSARARHAQLARGTDGALHLTWLQEAADPTASVHYARRSADGRWASPEVVAGSGVLSNSTEDQGPSIVLTDSGIPYVLYVAGPRSAGPCCDDGVRVRHRTASGWVADDPSRNVYTHAPQIYARGEDIYVFLGHDLAIDMAYLMRPAGGTWSETRKLSSGVTADGSASVRWDPQRETDPRVIDSLFFDEDIHDDGSFISQLYYVAVMPDGADDTTPPPAPRGLEQTGATATSVTLRWSAASPGDGVVEYGIQRDGQRVGTTTDPLATVGDLACDTAYEIAVDASDAAGNRSPLTKLSVRTDACDRTAPVVRVSAPVGGSRVSGEVGLAAEASDAGGVAGVQFLVDGAPVGAEDVQAPFEARWATAAVLDGSHVVQARARDRAGNEALSAPVTVTVSNVVASAGLVAAYGFDEGAGSVASDASGRGNDGLVQGPQWVSAGRHGGALSFDGDGDWVSVPDAASLDLTSGMTLEAWVRPSALDTVWRTVLFKERVGNLSYGLYANRDTGVPDAQVFVGNAREADAAGGLRIGEWAHLAATFDGSLLRLYVDGRQAAQLTVPGPIETSDGALRIGGNSVWREWFAGVIDDVRIYNRPLTATDIQTDMTLAIGIGDRTAPVVRVSAPVGGSRVSGEVGLVAEASDAGGVAGVQFLVDGAPVGAEDVQAPFDARWATAAVLDGSHVVQARARDRAGNEALSAPVTVTVSNVVASAGLVAAYGFDEGAGSVASDASGRGNDGLVQGPQWVSAGRHGGALSFDGDGDWVSVPDAASLDLTSGMTLEAWVRPSALDTVWRTVLFKERVGNLSYGLYANRDTGVPDAQVFVGNAREADAAGGLRIGEWAHLAATFDGSLLRLYVDGRQAAQLTVPGPIETSDGALRIGGNSVWREWFAGVIDDVRIYNRPLTATDIQTDMTLAIVQTWSPLDVLSGLTRSPGPSLGVGLGGG